MKIFRKINTLLFYRIKNIYSSIYYLIFTFLRDKNQKKINIELINKDLKSYRKIYKYFHYYFWNFMDREIIKHRLYFKSNQKGFGEDAFHSMWYLLFNTYRPKICLEIGVYRGQVISLWSLLSKILDYEIEIHGISPFEPIGDSVSEYIKNVNYLEDTKKNCLRFSHKLPNLHVGLSTDLKMVNIIDSKKWDLIYIDGSHNYEVVKKDFFVSFKNLAKDGLIIIDDSSVNLNYLNYPFSSKGHPGPSRVADEINKNQLIEILTVGHNRVFKKISDL